MDFSWDERHQIPRERGKAQEMPGTAEAKKGRRRDRNAEFETQPIENIQTPILPNLDQAVAAACQLRYTGRAN